MSIKGLLVKILQWIKAPAITWWSTRDNDAYYVAENDSTYNNVDHGKRKIGVGVSRSGNRGIWDYNHIASSNVGKWLICHEDKTDHTRILCEGATYPFVDHVRERSVRTDSAINWNYRWSRSGILECWGRFNGTANITSPSGGMYWTASAITLSDFPLSYTYTPAVTVTAQTKSGNSWATYEYASSSSTSPGKTTGLYGRSGTSIRPGT